MTLKKYFTIIGFVLLLLTGFAFQAKLLPFNTSSIERMPWFFQNTLYFVGNNYDIYQITRDSNGNWRDLRPVEGEVNTTSNEVSPCVLRNNDSELVMYFARYSESTDYDFYRAVFDEESGSWGKVRKVESLSTDTQDWDIWVSEDETLAYLTTKGTFGGADTLGGRDIWKSEKVEGVWSVPTNVSQLNSAGNEWSVFLAPDGKIWFDGSRDEVIGGYDVYYYDPDLKKIVHPGEELNSMYDERSVWTDGEIMFLSSSDRKGGAGSYDIYELSLSQERPEEIAEVEPASELTAPISELRKASGEAYVLEDQLVTTEGVALVESGQWHDKANYFAIADNAAGILVYGGGFVDPKIEKGDLVRVTGKLSRVGYTSDIGSLVVLPEGPEGVEILSRGNAVPLPKILFSDTAKNAFAAFEGRNVMLFGKVSQYDNETIARGFFLDGSSDGLYEDGRGEIKVKFYSYSQIDISSLAEGDFASVKGVLVLDKDGNYYLRPTEKSDVAKLTKNRLIFLTTLADNSLVEVQENVHQTQERRPLSPGRDKFPAGAVERLFATAQYERVFLSLYTLAGTRAGNGPAIYELIEGALEKLPLPGEAEYPSLTGEKLVFAARLSPDEQNSSWDIYLYDLKTAKLERVVASPSDEIEPTLSSDGDTLVFSRNNNGTWELVSFSLSAREEKLLLKGARNGAFSSEGETLFAQVFQGDWDIVELTDFSDPSALVSRVVLGTDWNETEPALSPDGKRLAFRADYRGVDEIFVLNVADHTLVPALSSSELAKHPFWSGERLGMAKYTQSGWELFFTELEALEETESVSARPGSTPLARPRLGSPAMVSSSTNRFELLPAEGYEISRASLVRGSAVVPLFLWNGLALFAGQPEEGLYDLQITFQRDGESFSWSEPHSVFLADETEQIKIVQLTDIHLGLARKPENREGFRELLDSLAQEKPTFAVITGDLSDAAQYYEEDYAFIRESIVELCDYPVFLVPGNHDSQRAGKVVGKEIWVALFGQLNYSFDWGDWHFLFADTGDSPYGIVNGMVSSEQLAWIEKDLSKSGKKGTVLFAHHNPYDTRWNFFEKETNRLAFLEALSKGEVRLALFGHRHSDAVDYHDGVIAVTTRKSLEKDFSGYRVIELQGEEIVEFSQELPKASKTK